MTITWEVESSLLPVSMLLLRKLAVLIKWNHFLMRALNNCSVEGYLALEASVLTYFLKFQKKY